MSASVALHFDDVEIEVRAVSLAIVQVVSDQVSNRGIIDVAHFVATAFSEAALADPSFRPHTDPKEHAIIVLRCFAFGFCRDIVSNQPTENVDPILDFILLVNTL